MRDGHYPIWGPIHFFAAVSERRPRLAGSAGVRLGRLGPEHPAGAPRRVHRLEPRAVVRDVGAARRASSGRSRTYSPPFQCGCYFEASPSVNGVAAAGLQPLHDGQRLHRPDARPRATSATAKSSDRRHTHDVVPEVLMQSIESDGRAGCASSSPRPEGIELPGCYDVLSAMILERAGLPGRLHERLRRSPRASSATRTSASRAWSRRRS